MRALVPLLSFVFFFCSFSVRAAADDWTAVPLGTPADIYAIENTWTSNHWVVGANGFAARSNGERTEWTIQNPNTTAALYSVVGGANEAWMGAGAGVVRLVVYNGWFERDLPNQADFRLFTRGGGKCVAVGPGGLMYRHEAGVWNEIESGVTVDLNGGTGIPTGPAWVVGSDGTIIRTTNGNLWTQVASGTTADLYGISELDLTNLYVVGEAGTILKSTNAGVSWSPRQSGTTRTLRAISISKSGTHTLLIAAGLGGTVLRSTDAGDSWCALNVTTTDLYTAEAFTDLEFFVGGAGGLLLRTINGGGPCGGATGVEIHNPTALSISDPFPQPSSDLAMVRVSVDQARSFHTEVFDVSGRLVLVLPEWRATSGGEHTIAVHTSALVPGVYFVRLRSDGLDASRRLVVAR
jgi:photosystem II stability/assembly factor-like uncharacterized protein